MIVFPNRLLVFEAAHCKKLHHDSSPQLKLPYLRQKTWNFQKQCGYTSCALHYWWILLCSKVFLLHASNGSRKGRSGRGETKPNGTENATTEIDKSVESHLQVYEGASWVGHFSLFTSLQYLQ